MAVGNILERKCFMELIATACDASLAMTEKETENALSLRGAKRRGSQ